MIASTVDSCSRWRSPSKITISKWNLRTLLIWCLRARPSWWSEGKIAVKGFEEEAVALFRSGVRQHLSNLPKTNGYDVIVRKVDTPTSFNLTSVPTTLLEQVTMAVQAPSTKRQKREDYRKAHKEDGLAELPKKKFYRQRAHANPFSDHQLT